MSDRGKAFVQVLSCVLSRLVAANDAVADGTAVTKFHALRPPSISIHDYCTRIHKYASCSPECFVLALVYIDRLIQRNSLLLTSLNVHRVIITAVMLAAKFFDDQYFNNAYYAKVGGVPTIEVNSLELEFLFSINFSLHVATDVYERYYFELDSHMQGSAAAGGCGCAAVASAIQYSNDEIRATMGMRSLEDMRRDAAAAAAAASGGGPYVEGSGGSGEQLQGPGQQQINPSSSEGATYGTNSSSSSSGMEGAGEANPMMYGAEGAGSSSSGSSSSSNRHGAGGGSSSSMAVDETAVAHQGYYEGKSGGGSSQM